MGITIGESTIGSNHVHLVIIYQLVDYLEKIKGSIQGMLADDTSPFFSKHQLKEGPSAPLIALRLKIAEEQQKRAAERGKGSITYETRTYVKRHEKGEDVYQISLEERRLKIRWGLRRMEKLRSQNLMFNNIDDARQAYFDRIRDLESKGYMDATAA